MASDPYASIDHAGLEPLPERRGQLLEHDLATSTPDHTVALAIITAAVSVCGMASTVLLALVGR